MAEKYIMLECNRLRANLNYKNIDEEEDTYKNRWVNNVNSYGIVVNPGDTITCESVAINTIGASDSTIEITGEPNKNGLVDNKVDITYSYYINDSGQNLIKLPLRNCISYLSDNGGYGHEGNPILKNNLKNRQLGEPSLFTSTDVGAITPNAPFIKDKLMPTANLVSYYELARDAPSIGEGYRVNGIYNATGGAGTNATFKVLEVISETAKAGIPSKIQLWVHGSGYQNNDVLTLTTSADGLSQPGTVKQKIIYYSVVNPNFASKQSSGPDGRRYYFTDNNYTGPCMFLFNGAPHNPLNGNTTDKINPIFKIRAETIKHEIPIGLNTPDNISTILTDQMHQPLRFDPTHTTRFFDYSKYFINSVDNKDNSVLVKPPIISTPTYQPMPTNGNGLFDNYESIHCFDGAKKLYYRQIGYDDPMRIKGASVFRRISYHLNNDDHNNGLNSGHNQSAGGDFGNQTIGDLGLVPALLQVIPSTIGNLRKCKLLDDGELVLTNIYFTENNLNLLSGGFRDAGKYWGATNIPIDTESDNYKENIAMALDLGLYMDEKSNGYPLNNTTQPNVLQNLPGQRNRYKCFHEMIGAPDQSLVITPVDFDATHTQGTGQGVDNYCVGSVPFAYEKHYDGYAYNDGQELSSIVVSSYFREDLKFNEDTDLTNGIYYNLHATLLTQRAGDNNKFGPFTTAWGVNEMFNNEYTDTGNGVKYNLNNLTALAKKYNLCVVPVWPDPLDNDFNKFGGRPYIAFRNHLPCSGGVLYDTKLNGFGASQKWQIDDRNCPYGIQIGFDASFIRNNGVMVYNTDFTSNLQFDDAKSFNSVVMFGASNPNISFDTDLSRFSITGLNTPMTIGNGLPTENQDNLTATGNPEQQVYNVNTPGQIGNVEQDTNGIPQTIGGQAIHNSILQLLNEDVAQTPDSFIDSLGGLAIDSIVLYEPNGQINTIQGNTYYANKNNTDLKYLEFDRDILNDTLLGKMGYDVEQLLPLFGSTQANFLDPLTFETSTLTYYDKYIQSPTPMITAAYISSAEYQPTQTNKLDMPLYGLGPNTGLPSAPSVSQASLTAQNLPSKLDYPYLLIYSSIISGGTNTEYYGGLDGKSKLPCVGYITRNYNEGDFFYGMEQSFNYTATKTFTLTEIETEIRLPDGRRPRLSRHNSVIYKITKPMILPNNIISTNNNGDNNDKRKKKYRETK